MKRVLNCRATDFLATKTKEELKNAILSSEGRTLMAEVASTTYPLYPDVTNAELLTTFGADFIILKGFDCFNPSIAGLKIDDIKLSKEEPKNIVQAIRLLTGRSIGINLEVAGSDEESKGNGRLVSEETIKQVKNLGADFICLTGYSKPQVTTERINEAISLAKEYFNGLIMVAKFNSYGVSEHISDYLSYVDKGADVIVLPAPGSVPGVTETKLNKTIEEIKANGALAMTTISTSQEGADKDTIREIALSSKRAGADIQSLGDAGIAGMGEPENIMTISMAIRGKRHTYIRMASSIVR
jgi:hypothetical protein